MGNKMRWTNALFVMGLVSCIAIPAANAQELDLPVKNLQQDPNFIEQPFYGVKNKFSIEQLQTCIKDGNKYGLVLDMSALTATLDGKRIDPSNIYGTLRIGPDPFESAEVNYTYKKFRVSNRIADGKSYIPVNTLLDPHINSEDWTDSGQLALRLELYLQTAEGPHTFLGIFDLFTGFKKTGETFLVQPAISEGPLVNLIRSDRPKQMVIAFKTTQVVKAQVVVDGKKTFTSSNPATWHEIVIDNLKPDRDYEYYVQYGPRRTKSFTFRTAPKTGKGDVIFAYAGDSRAGAGGGTSNLMGVNYRVMERTANAAYKLGAQLFLFGGDLVRGYTSSIADFRTQLSSWKQTMGGFWHQRPVYTCIGNHEALLRAFTSEGNKWYSLDRWPYDSEGVEAVFGREMVNPLNGPTPADPRRPTYKENVYSFIYGPVKFIAFNNNYWVGLQSGGLDTGPKDIGGCPEGYIMRDQMEWLQKELREGEANKKVKYIILFAQEPVFPNGGHAQDCMWYYGNNNVTAYTYDSASGMLKGEQDGIIDVRNRLVTMISENSKVAAVLGSDEHSYHKTLIARFVPIGDPPKDDPEGKGFVCREGFGCSPLDSIRYPTWYLTCGGAGAPYYNEEFTPWNAFWKRNPNICPRNTSLRGCYYYSSQENFLLFNASKKKISVTVYNPYGDIIDRIDNLLAVKSWR
jgi:3',5'-cyclic AMP phosphodiesterase CpdA